MMLRRLLAHARANAVAYLALFIALGGVGWAATNPLRDKPGAVKSSHIANGAVKERDLDPDLGLEEAKPPSDGEFDGEGGDAQLKVFFQDQKATQVIFTQLPIPPNKACSGLFPSLQIKTVHNEQYVTSTNGEGQHLQLQIQFDTPTHAVVLQGSLTQSADPTNCVLPTDLDLDRSGG